MSTPTTATATAAPPSRLPLAVVARKPSVLRWWGGGEGGLCPAELLASPPPEAAHRRQPCQPALRERSNAVRWSAVSRPFHIAQGVHPLLPAATGEARQPEHPPPLLTHSCGSTACEQQHSQCMQPRRRGVHRPLSRMRTGGAATYTPRRSLHPRVCHQLVLLHLPPGGTGRALCWSWSATPCLAMLRLKRGCQAAHTEPAQLKLLDCGSWASQAGPYAAVQQHLRVQAVAACIAQRLN